MAIRKGKPSSRKPDQLIKAAEKARKKAYCPYSRFAVGAAGRTADGQIFGGCNVESPTYGLTVCAERVAAYKAVSEGAAEIVEVVVVTDSESPASPCGACRQVLWDLAPHARVTYANLSGKQIKSSVKALLPDAFDAGTLPALGLIDRRR